MADLTAVTLADVEAAAERIAPWTHRTPIMRSEQLVQLTGTSVSFKCENLQKVGAFKARGACNAVFSMADETAARGVATHSSGNHGQAVAMAAARRGIAAHVVMPANAPQVKKDAVRGYGAEVVECEPTQAARQATLEQVIARTGAEMIHPYDDPRVIAGQGTVALEILAQMSEVQAVVVPVGGGGLLAGTALTVKSLRPEVEVIAVEPEGADDAFRSFGLGRLIPQTDPNTIADGLRTSLGELNYAIIREHVDTIVTVPDTRIVEAMQLVWTRLKTVVEPSGAVSFAGILEHPERFAGREVCAVFSGGNVDLGSLPW